MGRNPIDLTEQRFGRWLAIERANTERRPSGRKKWGWLCQCDCGNRHVVETGTLLRGHSRSCGCLMKEAKKAQRGSKHPSWKGGKAVCSTGYIKAYAPEHPRADNGRYVLEHHLIMEQALGRLLYPDETIHHKNGVRTDNRLENLELWSSNHPSGQRVSNLLDWADEIIRCYRDTGANSAAKSKPEHMLQTRATEKAISMTLGTGASSMPSEDEIGG